LIDQTGFMNLPQTLSSEGLAVKNASSSAQFATNFDQSLNSILVKRDNLPKTAQTFLQLLNQKHLMLFSQDLKTLSLLNIQNWSGKISSATETEEVKDFLSLSQTNLGQVSDDQIKRSINLVTAINEDGGVEGHLNVKFTNKTSQNYSGNLKIYLPLGSRLSSAKFNNQDILSSASSKVDFGRAVYGLNLNLITGDQNSLEVSYQLADKLWQDINKKQDSYQLNISKQPGTGADNLSWSVSYPATWQVVNRSQNLNGGVNVQTDLEEDRQFDLTFQKP
jgi:hypothetical protein